MEDQELKQQGEQVEQEEKPKPKRQKAETYKVIASGDVYICGHRVKRGGTYEVTADDRKDKRKMAKLSRSVELGLVEKV